MAVRVPWNEHEAVLLVEAYLAVVGGEKRSAVTARLSQALRAMGRRRGISVDSVFRNVNGMNMKLDNVEYLFTEGKKGLSDANIAIRTVYHLFQEQPDEFQKLSAEAHELAHYALAAEANAKTEADAASDADAAGRSTSVTSIIEKDYNSLQVTVDDFSRPGEARPQRDEAAERRILRLAADTFPGGFRPTSVIDIRKLQSAYEEKYGESFPESIDAAELIRGAGFSVGDKVHLLSEEQKRKLREMILSIVDEGYYVIDYSELRERQSALLEECHLYESSQLQCVFKSILPEMCVCEQRVLAGWANMEVRELTRAFGNDRLLTLEQLRRRRPYMSLETMRQTLSDNPQFFRAGVNTWVLGWNVELAEEDIDVIEYELLPKLQQGGCWSVGRLPVEQTSALNPELSLSTLQEVMYHYTLEAMCERHGLIFTLKGSGLSTAELLEAWCRSNDALTLAEIDAYAREALGRRSDAGLLAAWRTMVRVDRGHFVSDARLQFDVEATDRAVELFVGERTVSITAFTSFTSFPALEGYAWNLWLLESFLNRFSQKFCISGGPARSDNVGVVCARDKKLKNYNDMLARAVIQDRVELTYESVENYLLSRKYLLNRCNAIQDVLDRARRLREGVSGGVRL